MAIKFYSIRSLWSCKIYLLHTSEVGTDIIIFKSLNQKKKQYISKNITIGVVPISLIPLIDLINFEFLEYV